MGEETNSGRIVGNAFCQPEMNIGKKQGYCEKSNGFF